VLHYSRRCIAKVSGESYWPNDFQPRRFFDFDMAFYDSDMSRDFDEANIKDFATESANIGRG
jgi:hypothetical protein